MATQQRTRGRRIGRLSRAAWLLVLVMMLAAAGWSISGTLTGWGMNHRLALGLSLMFDLAGLICADYARRAIERGTPAGLPRLALAGFVAVSGALNWSHGQRIGGTAAGIGLASISAAVELLFELHRRDVRDEQRAARGLVAERLPHIPLLGWVMYPGRSWATLRGAVGARLDTLDPLQQTAPPAAAPAAPEPGAVAVQPTPAAAPVTPPVQPEPLVYADPRCHAVRPLYDAGHRPTTGSMRTAIVAAGDPRADPRRGRAARTAPRRPPAGDAAAPQDRTVTTAACLAVCLLLMLGAALGLLRVDRRALPPVLVTAALITAAAAYVAALLAL
jgi:hypothetical protein